MNVRIPGLLWATLAYTLLLEAMLAPAVLFWPDFAENLAAHFRASRSVSSTGPCQGVPPARFFSLLR